MDESAAIAVDLRRVLACGVTAVAVATPAPPVPGCTRCEGPRLVICLSGRHRMRVAGHIGVVELGPGQVLMMPDGTWNRAEPGRRRRYASFTLQADGLRAFLRRHDGRSLATSPAHFALLPRPSPDDEALWRLVLDAGADARSALVGALVWRCLLALEQPAPSRRSSARQRWATIAAWLVEQLPVLPGRDATAECFALHPAYLSQLCRDHAGCSFQDWCGRQRVHHARILLHAHPQMTVAAVAEHCGYADLRHFRRMFRRHLKQAPGDSRASRRKP